MTGLLALLDDIAAIAKLAAAQLDDVAGQAARVGLKAGAAALDDAAKAGSKAAGVIIDDTAVTPKYVTGLPAARELPIVWQIARGSLFNKLVILLPAALVLEAFLPWLLAPLLMLGGAYLCFEGAEKVLRIFHPHPAEKRLESAETLDAAHLEKARVKGAIQTDFILSAEIMTIALSTLEEGGPGLAAIVRAAIVLAVVAVVLTVLVYGAVGLLVKADDLGLLLAQVGRTPVSRGIGRGIVRAMPPVMAAIGTLGTTAMLWVGGSIVVHALHQLGWDLPYDLVHGASHAVAPNGGLLGWLVTAALDGVGGLALGLALAFTVPPLVRLVRPRPHAA